MGWFTVAWHRYKWRRRERQNAPVPLSERPPSVEYPASDAGTADDGTVTQPEVSRDTLPPAGSRIRVVTSWCEGEAGRLLEPEGDEVVLTVKEILPGPPPAIRVTINKQHQVHDFQWTSIWRGVEAYNRRSAGY